MLISKSGIRCSYFLLQFTVILFSTSAAYGQILDAQKTGSLQGTVRDSVTLEAISPATVTVYKLPDTSLASYRLSNESGRFHFESLPLDTSLLLVVTYVGYKTTARKIHLTKEKRKFTIDDILLIEAASTLNEITILRPPIMVRADTIEFYVDAFKTKRNAVIGDLLNILPGLIIWGDGTVTVNGKPVTKVLVNGKIFFSEDMRIATDNLPTTIVEKIQLYSDNTKNNNSDTLNNMTMNIALKKGKDSGVFGKIGSSFGTNETHQSDLMLAGFTSKSQFSAVGTTNNINKALLNVGEMMLNNSFSPNATYSKLNESDFEMAGRNTLGAIGGYHNYKWENKNENRAEYIFNSNQSKINKNEISHLFLPDSSITKTTFQNVQNKNSSHTLNEKFDINNAINKLSLNATYKASTQEHSVNTEYAAKSSSGESLNYGNMSRTNISNDNSISLRSNFSHTEDYTTSRKIAKKNFTGAYTADIAKRSSNTNSSSQLNTDDNREETIINRLFEENFHSVHQKLELNYFSLLELTGIRIPNLRATLNSNFNYSFNSSNVRVFDRQDPSTTNKYNDQLSRDTKHSFINQTPSLELSKTYSKAYANRYVKFLELMIKSQAQYAVQDNKSDKVELAITRYYRNFFPTIGIKYTNRQINICESSLLLRYEEAIELPDISDLVRLIDSTEQTYIQIPNRELQESRSKSIRANFEWFKFGKTAPRLDVKFSTTRTNNFFSEQSIFNTRNQHLFAKINLNGYERSTLYSSITKPFAINKNIATFIGYFNFIRIYTPFRFQGKNSASINNIISVGTSLSFNMRGSLMINLMETYSRYSSKIIDNASLNSFQNNEFRLHLIYIIGDKVKVNSYTHWQSRWNAGTAQNANFMICNFSASQRIGKGDQFELKFAVNDIFKQNSGLRFFNISNVSTTESVNRLQRYASIAFGYFPRKFPK